MPHCQNCRRDPCECSPPPATPRVNIAAKVLAVIALEGIHLFWRWAINKLSASQSIRCFSSSYSTGHCSSQWEWSWGGRPVTYSSSSCTHEDTTGTDTTTTGEATSCSSSAAPVVMSTQESTTQQCTTADSASAAPSNSTTECTICFEQRVDMYFVALRCGHVFCSRCAGRVSECPKCRGTTSGRLRLYLD